MKGYIRKRGEHSWAISVYAGKDKDGKKQYVYRTVRGTKREAERQMNEIINSINTGQFVRPAKMTLGEFLTKWLEDYARGAVRQVTYDTYEMLVRVHIVPSLGHIPLEKLAPLDIQRFYTQKLQGPRSDGKPGCLSPKTVKHMHQILRESLKHAVKWRLIAASPADLVDPPKARPKDIKVWTPEQVTHFLNVARGDRLYAAFLLPLTTGLRRGELLGLRWEDVNLERGLLKVSQSLVPTRKGPVIQQPKTASSRRVVLLSGETVQALRGHLARQNEEKEIFQEMYQDRGLVFCLPDGRPLDPRAFTRTFDVLVARSGLPRINFHALRHTHATLLLEAGVHPKVVSERLGHADISTSMDTYTHVLPSLQHQAAQMIDKVITGGHGTSVH